MKRPLALGLVLLCLLGLADVLVGTAVLGQFRGARMELGRFKRSQLDEATQQRLARLTDRVFLTLYVSPREAMPSALRRLEAEATDVLVALRDGSSGMVDFQIVDPGADADLQRFAARRRITPVRMRTVERDGWSEATVWSILTIESGRHAPVVINGLRPELLPRLQELIGAHLDQLESPRRPRFAVAAPPGRAATLATMLAERGEVLSVDLDGGEPLPQDADVLFWLDPARGEAATVRALERFVASGRSVVLAGSGVLLSALQSAPAVDDGEVSGLVAFAEREDAMRPLLNGFGLGRRDGLLCDPMSQAVVLAGANMPAPWIIRCIAPAQDFRSFRGQPNGHLMFDAPQPFVPDLARLSERGATAEILGTTSDRAYQLPFPAGLVPIPGLTAEAGTAAPRAPLMIAVRPDDPRQGLVVALASSSPLRDGYLDMTGAAHRLLVRTLVDTLASSERLVAARLGLSGPAPLPELQPGARAGWRAAVMGGLPALLLAAGLLRGAFRSAERPAAALRAARARFATGIWLRALAGLCLIALAAAWLRGAPRLDLTADGLNLLHPRTRELAQAANGTGALQAELFLSAPDRLPPALRGGVARLQDLLRELRAAGADLTTTLRSPDDESAAAVAELEAAGIVPVPFRSRDEETTQVRHVWSSLRLSRADGTAVTTLRFPDETAFESLEFRLAFALWRLQTGREVTVGFASDAARLSAAEAHELYQQQGLFAPIAGDSYGLARERLRAADFRIEEVNPRGGELPSGLDALVWMQPRRSIEAMLESVALYLHGGGRALIAAQHFVMQSRQFPGGDYRIVYWPQPQTPDIDRLWLPELGISLVRTVLFDELRTAVPIETMVYGSGERQRVESEVALPFVPRVSASNFARDSAVTRRLGDQVFPFAAHFELDPERLAAAGLTAQVLATTSDGSWEFEWAGGWIPDELLAGPPQEADGSLRWLGSVPLALDVQGSFPLPAEAIVALPPLRGPDGTLLAEQPVAVWPPPDAPPSRPGRLLLIGASEPFRNARIGHAEFRADQLLLNAVASLALDAELADVASRRPVARGFGLVAQAERLRWRGIVLGALPVALLALAPLWLLARRRAPRRFAAAAVAPAAEDPT